MNSISDHSFTRIVKESFYYKEVAKKGNIVSTKGIKKRIESLNIDISHFKFDAPQIDIFCLKSFSQIRKRIINENLIPFVCKNCEIKPIWNDKPLSLQLDHIDGNRHNNCLENYRFLCPNCHSQTETHSRHKRYEKYEIEHIKSNEKIVFQTLKDIGDYLHTSDSSIRRWIERQDEYKDYTISLIN